MAETKIPTKSNQPGTDTGLEISPDGGVIQQLSSPASATKLPSSSDSTTMANSPSVDESGNAVSPKTEEQIKQSESEKNVEVTEFLKAKETRELTDEIQKQKTSENEIQKDKEVKLEAQPSSQTKTPIAERKAQDAATRDLTGLPEELVPHFQKDMSRAAFDKVKPIVLEHKSLKEQSIADKAEIEKLKKGGLPDSYYDNPVGFMLDPEYQKAEGLTYQAQAILNHWQQQFKKVRDGAVEYETLGYDPQGNLSISGKAPATKDSEFQIMQIVNNAQQQVFQVAAKSEAVKQAFKDKHTNALQWLNQYEDKAFNFFKTEQGKQFEPQLKSIISEFPSELRNHPLAKVLAKSIATNVHLATILTQNAGKANSAAPQLQTKTVNGKPATVIEQQKRAGPTVADTGAASSSGNNGNEKDVTIDMFDAVKAGVD